MLECDTGDPALEQLRVFVFYKCVLFGLVVHSCHKLEFDPNMDTIGIE